MIEGTNLPLWKFKGLLRTVAATVMFAALLAADPTLHPALAADAVKTVKPIDTTRLPWDMMGLAKLVQSGVSEQVVLAYIKGNPPKRTPTAEEVVYLHELGLTNDGIITLLEAAPKLSQSVATFAPATPPVTTPVAEPAAPAQAAAPVAPAPAAAPANTVISAPAPTVVYTQPVPTTVYVERPPVVTYVDPYPRISIGFGFGHYWGHHHHRGHYYHGHRGWHR